jgi:RHS repeat-associated protein
MSYDRGPRRQVFVAGVEDANGNTLNDGMNSYSWDARNRLVSANNNAASFSYDPLGRRESKTILSTTTAFLYDGANAVQESGTNGTANLLTGGLDERFSRTDAAGTYDYLTDALGSTLALTDATGASVEQYSYDPYGSQSASGAATTNSYTYTGRESDGLGINYYRARYYNPQIGRFLSEDPLGLAGGDVNFYAYVANDPIDLIDPSGLTWESNWNYFWDWALGRGAKTRNYGPNDPETQELMNSPGVNRLRDAFNNGGCKSQKHLSYGTYEAYWDTTVNPLSADWSNTAAEVGGFGGASIVNNGNGTATYTIPNTSGTHSFFLHAVPDRSSPTGPMSNIYQNFQWTEPLSGRSCGCQQ